MALSLNTPRSGKLFLNRLNLLRYVEYNRLDNQNKSPVLIQKRQSSCGGDSPVKCKVALITGGARGIGLAIGESLLANEAQAIIIGDVLADECEKVCCKLNQKYGENKALFQPLDVTKKDQMEKIFKCTKDRFGKIDIVINNAGILNDCRWEDTIKINAAALVHGTLLGFEYMSAEKCGPGGVIINVASILGLQPLFSSPVYVGTKHFVIGFTRSMGHEYFCKCSKVKVMAVCPGVTDTAMITGASQGGALPGYPDLGKELAKSLGSLPSQPAEEVGKGVITMIKDGENGSIWVSEACEFYKAILPDRKTFKPPPCPPPPACPPPPPPCPPPKPVCPPPPPPCPPPKPACPPPPPPPPCPPPKPKDPCKKEEKPDPCKKDDKGTSTSKKDDPKKDAPKKK